MLFYRFISENLTSYINQLERAAGDADFDYLTLSDFDAGFGRAETVREKGFYILPSALFANVRGRARFDANLNETLSRILADIEGSANGTDSEHDIKSLFDDLDVNSSKLGPTVAKRNEKLVKLLDAIGDLPLTNDGGFSANSIDLFGDAFEYLMQMYASTAGKSGGEFYTPQEVSDLLARITVVGKTEVNEVYDPACGSGSLLPNFAKVLGNDKVRQGFFGQEINLTTYNLCRINMFLHDVNFEKFDIAHGDTLPDRQQLRRCGDPIAARPVLRYHHYHLHRRAEEIQARQRHPVHRRRRRVRAQRQQEQAVAGALRWESKTTGKSGYAPACANGFAEVQVGKLLHGLGPGKWRWRPTSTLVGPLVGPIQSDFLERDRRARNSTC